MVHMRFNEIFCDEDPLALFGNKNVVVLGDLLQLPPVKADFVFEKIKQRAREKAIGGFGMHAPLWESFEYQ